MKYTLHLISFKQRWNQNKKIREITEHTVCDGISFDLAKFLAVKEYCRLVFFDKNMKICLKDKAKSAIGYVYCAGKGIIATINPQIKFKDCRLNISINPVYNKITFTRKFDWSRLDNFLEKKESNLTDYSIEAFHIWGPESLIPKGYYHVKNGNVKEGDYYFKDDHWINTNVSFSPIKVGAEIKETGVLYSGKHVGRDENESVRYYSQFIIREKSKPV